MQVWNGGLRPVSSDATVVYRLRNGSEGMARAGALRWDHYNGETDLFYKLAQAYDIVAWKPMVEKLTGLRVKAKKLDPKARPPEYATDGSGCFDLFATNGGTIGSMLPNTPNSDTMIFGTGLAFEIPVGHVMLIFSRSGHGFKDEVRLSNCVGVIDSDYRGEVMVKLKIDKKAAVIRSFEAGERIAQALIVPFQRVAFDLVDELGDSARGEGGFGSTGA